MEMTSIPRISPGCRLHPTEEILLVPEGMLSLSGPARQILAQLDGVRNVTEIVHKLAGEFEGADPQEIGTDVLDLLNRMEDRGVVRA